MFQLFFCALVYPVGNECARGCAENLARVVVVPFRSKIVVCHNAVEHRCLGISGLNPLHRRHSARLNALSVVANQVLVTFSFGKIQSACPVVLAPWQFAHVFEKTSF